MIKLENVVLASADQMEFIIEGMRNPMNSWDKSDSRYSCLCMDDKRDCPLGPYIVGENDHSLMQRLANAGTDHRKFMRMMPVYVRITAPLYWWKEFDTYKVGTVANSCSTMHKIMDKEFTLEDFSVERMSDYLLVGVEALVDTLNTLRDLYINYDKYDDPETPKQKILDSLIQLLPSSYNQTRNIMMNYEVLANIYKSRKDHKLDEWREFCKWIKELPYSELIIDISSLKSVEVGETITAEFKPKILFGEPFPWIKEDKED